jgi:hypothetical protein
MGAEVILRDEDPRLFRENVHKSWQVMSAIVNQISDECFIAHLEPNQGVGYDCLSIVTRDREGRLEVALMMNRNGVNSNIKGAEDLYKDTWRRVKQDGAEKVADEIIGLSNLTRTTDRIDSPSTRACHQVLNWIEENQQEEFFVVPLSWLYGSGQMLEIKPATYSEEQWPVPDHGPEISMGISGKELQRLEMLTSGIPSKEDPKIEKIFKITTVNGQGDEIIAYVRQNYKQAYLRTMMEEYGNSIAVEIDIADIPADVDIPQWVEHNHSQRRQKIKREQ